MRLLTEDILAEIDLPDPTVDRMASAAISSAEATLSLQVFLRLTHGSHLLLDRDWSPEVVFWSRYYWFRRFVRIQALSAGFDAGLEQQAFQILETPYPDCEVDWSLLETVETAVEQSLSALSPTNNLQ